MRVAVASDDGQSIARHLGRSRYFLIFDVEDDRIIARSFRDNTFTAHARGACDGEHPRGHHEHEPHGDLAEALQDCAVVLSRGMGWRAAEALKRRGIEGFVIPADLTPQDAVRALLEGRAPVALDFCRGHHTESSHEA